MYSVAYTFGCGNPDVAALKFDSENVAVCGGGGDLDRRDLSVVVADGHLGIARSEGWAIDGPVDAVDVSEAFVGAEPCVVGVDALYDVGEVAGKAAVLGEEVVPVTAVVAAVAEVGGDPEDVVFFEIAYGRGDFVDESLVFKEDQLGFAIGVVVFVPGFFLLIVLENAAAPYGVVDLSGSGGDSVDPDLVHGRVALVVERPLIGAEIEH